MEIPDKLKIDSILESVCEIRFDSEDFPEVILGKLLEIPIWKDFKRTRTAIADIPAPVRSQDEQLRYQALMQLISEDRTIAVKIGSNVIAYNNIKKYKGWNNYFSEIKSCVKSLLESQKGINIRRIGLRYINAMNNKDHLIDSINDLNIDVNIADSKLSSSYNLNYVRKFSELHEATVRISTPEFVKGLPEGSTTLIDIDVYSKNTINLQNEKEIVSWIDEAHTFEKKEFFGLIPDYIKKQLIEK